MLCPLDPDHFDSSEIYQVVSRRPLEKSQLYQPTDWALDILQDSEDDGWRGGTITLQALLM